MEKAAEVQRRKMRIPFFDNLQLKAEETEVLVPLKMGHLVAEKMQGSNFYNCNLFPRNLENH